MQTDGLNEVSMSSASEEDSNTTVEIKIKTKDSQIYTLRVNKYVPISTLKEKIATVTGVLSEQQRLIFNGRFLKDDQLLSAHHVEDGHMLHLVSRPSTAQPGNALGSEGSHHQVNSASSSGHNSRNSTSRSAVIEAVYMGQGERSTSDVSRVIPDALTTIYQFLGHMRNEFMREAFRDTGEFNNGGYSSSIHFNQDQNHGFQSSAISGPAGLPSTESLAEIMVAASELLREQAVRRLSQLAGQLENQASVRDPVERGNIQSSAIRSGVHMHHLGLLFLELGRTIRTLHMGQTPVEALVNAGPAVYISESGPNDITDQPTRPYKYPCSSHGGIHTGTAHYGLGLEGFESSQSVPVDNNSDLSRAQAEQDVSTTITEMLTRFPERLNSVSAVEEINGTFAFHQNRVTDPSINQSGTTDGAPNEPEVNEDADSSVPQAQSMNLNDTSSSQDRREPPEAPSSKRLKKD